MELKLRLPPDLLEQEAVQTEPLTLASLIAQLRKDFQEACKPTNPPWSRSLQQLFGWLEKYVEFQTHQVQFASLSWVFSRGTAVGRSHECHEHQPADSALSVDDFLASLHRTDEAGLAGVTLDHDPCLSKLHLDQKHVFFVSIPLALYVRNTPHLYEVTSRMRHLRVSSCSEIPERARSLEMREALDAGDGKPYSCLVYLLMAALQALFAVCREHGKAVRPGHARSVDLRSLLPLSGSAPEGLLPVDLTASLLFRGLWVPEVIDEEAASWQWSFNSFSRYISGALHVLNFYASSHSKVSQVANTHRHVLLLVMRRFALIRVHTPQKQDWAFPVQFFNGVNGRLEHEFVLPPFVEYTFEEDLEVCSCMPASQQEDRFGELSRRWKLQRPLTEEVPELRQLLGCSTVLLRNPHLEATWGRKETQDANGSNAEPPCARRKWTFGARTARLDRPAVFLLRDFAWMLPEYAGHTPSQFFQVLHRQKSLPAPPHTPLLCFRSATI